MMPEKRMGDHVKQGRRAGFTLENMHFTDKARWFNASNE